MRVLASLLAFLLLATGVHAQPASGPGPGPVPPNPAINSVAAAINLAMVLPPLNGSTDNGAAFNTFAAAQPAGTCFEIPPNATLASSVTLSLAVANQCLIGDSGSSVKVLASATISGGAAILLSASGTRLNNVTVDGSAYIGANIIDGIDTSGNVTGIQLVQPNVHDVTGKCYSWPGAVVVVATNLIYKSCGKNTQAVTANNSTQGSAEAFIDLEGIVGDRTNLAPSDDTVVAVQIKGNPAHPTHLIGHGWTLREPVNPTGSSVETVGVTVAYGAVDNVNVYDGGIGVSNATLANNFNLTNFQCHGGNAWCREEPGGAPINGVTATGSITSNVLTLTAYAGGTRTPQVGDTLANVSGTPTIASITTPWNGTTGVYGVTHADFASTAITFNFANNTTGGIGANRFGDIIDGLGSDGVIRMAYCNENGNSGGPVNSSDVICRNFLGDGIHVFKAKHDLNYVNWDIDCTNATGYSGDNFGISIAGDTSGNQPYNVRLQNIAIHGGSQSNCTHAIAITNASNVTGRIFADGFTGTNAPVYLNATNGQTIDNVDLIVDIGPNMPTANMVSIRTVTGGIIGNHVRLCGMNFAPYAAGWTGCMVSAASGLVQVFSTTATSPVGVEDGAAGSTAIGSDGSTWLKTSALGGNLNSWTLLYDNTGASAAFAGTSGLVTINGGASSTDTHINSGTGPGNFVAGGPNNQTNLQSYRTNFSGVIVKNLYTVSSGSGAPALPTTAGTGKIQGASGAVIDAVTCVFGSTPTGGGGTFCPVIYNGSAWVAG